MSSGMQQKDELQLRNDLCLPGLKLDDLDKLMAEGSLEPMERYYPNLDIDRDEQSKPFNGHNLMVVQPWVSYANFGFDTDPDLQLEECVSLGNTIHNWKVLDKKIIFSNQLNRKHVFGPKSFGELKEYISSKTGISAVFFGVEVLSAMQLKSIEKELKMPVFDRFTVVLNIFRQHARTKEAKLQLALAEIPYIKSHLREIHESTEYSSSVESLKMLVGGSGESFYHRRLSILKRRESRLKALLEDLHRQREVSKRSRKRLHLPLISVVGYTNCGKTSLIKHLTADESMTPKNQLFATLDVTVHKGQLRSTKDVLYLDTVGFISRVPILLVAAFSSTLKDVQESDLIIHVLDVNHPDHRLQYSTVMKALTSLEVSKGLLATKINVGNKVDLLDPEDTRKELPKCDITTSVTKNINLDELADKIDAQLVKNLNHQELTLRVENGGEKYMWLLKNAALSQCLPDKQDANYLICKATMSPIARGRWQKQFGELSSYSIECAH